MMIGSEDSRGQKVEGADEKSCISRHTGATSSVAVDFPDGDVCRGIYVRGVLGLFGRVLSRGRRGNRLDYTLSHPAEVLDAFLSHTWNSSSSEKSLAIMLHFNDLPAIIMANFAVFVTMAFYLWRPLPVYCYEKESGETQGRGWTECPEADLRADSIWCYIVGIGVYAAVLTMGQRIASLIPEAAALKISERFRSFCHPVVFLDKTCIQQCGEHATIEETCEDCQRKFDGICHLGAFLRRSRKLLVLYSCDYFERMWCCYEFACFLALKSMEHIRILPLRRVGITLMLWFVSFVLIGGYKMLILIGVPDRSRRLLFIGVMWFCFFALTWMLRAWGIERNQICNCIRNFDVEKAQCAVNSDRELILRRIARWSRTRVPDPKFEKKKSSKGALGLAPPDASEDVAIGAFNDFVRSKGQKAMKNCMGTSPLPYMSLLAVLSSFMWSDIDRIVAKLSVDRYRWEDAVVEGVESISESFIFIPLCVAILSRLAPRCAEEPSWGPECFRRLLRRPRIRSILVCALLAIAAMAGVHFSNCGLNALSDIIKGEEDNDDDHITTLSRGEPNWVFLLIYIPLDVAGAVSLYVLQTWPRCKPSWGESVLSPSNSSLSSDWLPSFRSEVVPGRAIPAMPEPPAIPSEPAPDLYVSGSDWMPTSPGTSLDESLTSDVV